MLTHLRTIVWVGVLLLCAFPTYAQTSQIRRNTPLYFDHDEESLKITTRYQLCQDEVTETACRDVAAVRLQGTLTFQFALPTWVANGAHIYAVRAFGEGEWSDPSNALTVVVTGKPLPPSNHRITPPPAMTGTPTSTPPPAPVATLQPAGIGGGLRTKP